LFCCAWFVATVLLAGDGSFRVSILLFYPVLLRVSDSGEGEMVVVGGGEGGGEWSGRWIMRAMIEAMVEANCKGDDNDADDEHDNNDHADADGDVDGDDCERPDKPCEFHLVTF
jgi:hypothetical protein